MAAIARNHGGQESPEKSSSFLEMTSSYFDELDFEADLDYSPLDELGNGNEVDEENEPGSDSGLIIPGQ